MNPDRLSDDFEPYTQNEVSGFSKNNPSLPPKSADRISSWAPPVVAGKTPFALPNNTVQNRRMQHAARVNEREKQYLQEYGHYHKHQNERVIKFALISIGSIFVLYTLFRR